MTEDRSAISHLSVAMTTVTTGGNTVPSSSSRGAEFYFQCVALVIGVVGTATNAVILYALVASKQHKKHLLIVHQNVLDMFSSFFIMIVYSLKLCNIYLTGSIGYWLCTLLLSESLIWWGTIGSAINLAFITIDRYTKVVHAVWSKKELRNWIIYLSMAFAWIVSFIASVAVVFPTSAVVDGACYPYMMWGSQTIRVVYYIGNVVLFYVLVLVIFIVCYWRILIVLRRQAKVLASHSVARGSTARVKSNQMQWNVIKTMIFVSALYAISWLPSYVFYLYVTLNPNYMPHPGAYYASVIITFLYLCVNPFIYAAKFHPVKRVLRRLILCKNASESGTVLAYFTLLNGRNS